MALLIRGGQVLVGPNALGRSADVLIDGDRIIAVGPRLTAPDGTRTIDAAGRVVVPGLINAHTHAHNNLTRGQVGTWTLEDFINHAPAMNGHRSPEDHYLSAMIGALEMVKTGCTAAYDLFAAIPAPSVEAIEAVLRAYADVGLRVVLAPLVADVPFHRTVPGLLELLPAELRSAVERAQAAPTDGLLRLNEEVIRRWHGPAGGMIRVALAPTIPGQCSDAYLRGCVRLVQDYGVGVHTHLAESKVQVVHALNQWGKTPVARLAELGLLGSGFVGAHGIWLTGDDLRLLADAGAGIAHNPTSNLRIGTGIAPVREMLDAGLAVGLGSDGSASSDNQNLFDVLRLAPLISTVRFPHQPERWLDAETVWRMGTAGGARLLGLADDVGSIEPGRKADVVLVRADSLFMRPLVDPVRALVYAETGANVETVLIDGRIVVERGRVVTVDETALYARGQQAAEAQRQRGARDWAAAEALTPYLSRACRAAVAIPYTVNRYAVPVEHP